MKVSSIDVGDQMKGVHLGTIRVEAVLGWKYRLRMAVALFFLRIGVSIAPARIDIEADA